MTGGFSGAAFLLVAAGGAVGSVLRYAVALLLLPLAGTGFPWPTLAVNLVGSALIGIAAGAGLEGHARLLVVTGFLGGFTTFSAFSLETGALFERSPLLAAAYVLASVGLGIAAFALAYAFMRR